MTDDDTAPGVKVAQIPPATSGAAICGWSLARWDWLEHRALRRPLPDVHRRYGVRQHRAVSQSKGDRHCLHHETVELAAARRAYPCWELLGRAVEGDDDGRPPDEGCPAGETSEAANKSKPRTENQSSGWAP